MDKFILVKGARVNNLKNIDVAIPRNKFVVITGLSGSGKSSLAFDTLYAEGQRRYVESLSSYARQFLGRMSKPECDFIKGLPPAIAIEQKVVTRNARSTVGTSTEIYDYLRMLFARVGKTISPVSGDVVKKHTPEDIINCVLNYPEGTRFALVSPIVIKQGRTVAQQLEVLMKEGFSRLENNGNFVDIADCMSMTDLSGYSLLIDRMSVSLGKEMRSRLFDSIETAFFEGGDECAVKVWSADGVVTHLFSKKFECDGITFTEPSDLMFNFNNPLGACPLCEGYGKVTGIDEDLVIPNKTLSVYQDAVMCWRGEKMSEWKNQFIRFATGFPIHRPYYQLTDDERHLLWEGNGKVKGINDFFRWIETKKYEIQYRVMLARYRGKRACPECGGTRLKKDAQYVKIDGKSITDLVKMSVLDLKEWFASLQLDETQQLVAKRLLTEIRHRIDFLVEIGLGYLTLDRLSSTLSGGESQRINIATSLGSSLVGSLYILDEPSIGLHSKDTGKLINVLRMLQKIGNTVVVVEHDEEIIRAADYLIDIGPEAGRKGGEVVYQGDVAHLDSASSSYTLQYLTGQRSIPVPKQRRRWTDYILVRGAAANNLKGVDVKFPLGVMTVVTGVSGSGKSTLVKEILYKTVAKHLEIGFEAPGTHIAIDGDLNRVRDVQFIDQNPIGKSTRSNPATYLKAFDEIRRLFAECQVAKQMGFTAGHFSFNTPGGRCEECKGEGTITVEMQFMADITLPCEACHGKRFKKEVLDVEYRGKNISDILDMTINQAIEFFEETPGGVEARIVKRLKPLQDVGLGYVKLGQSSSTLSGGENQRVKLAYYLAEERSGGTLFIFDEPTTGLHFHDINTLLDSLQRLIARGNSLVIIEHNMDVIKCADWIIDMGPEGGDKGGNVVFAGTPEQLAQCADSHTARFLKEKLQ